MRFLLLNRLSGLNCRAASLMPLWTARALSSTQLPGNWGADVLKGNTVRSGGSIRESGGAFGEREHALEEIYFRNVTSHQLENLRDHHLDEINHLEKELKTSEESLKRHKMRLENLKKLVSHIQ